MQMKRSDGPMKLKSSNFDILGGSSGDLSLSSGHFREVPEDKFCAQLYLDAREKVKEEHMRTLRMAQNVDKKTGRNELHDVMDKLLGELDFDVGG
jgi:hypothetical protein